MTIGYDFQFHIWAIKKIMNFLSLIFRVFNRSSYFMCLLMILQFFNNFSKYSAQHSNIFSSFPIKFPFLSLHGIICYGNSFHSCAQLSEWVSTFFLFKRLLCAPELFLFLFPFSSSCIFYLPLFFFSSLHLNLLLFFFI